MLVDRGLEPNGLCCRTLSTSSRGESERRWRSGQLHNSNTVYDTNTPQTNLEADGELLLADHVDYRQLVSTDWVVRM